MSPNLLTTIHRSWYELSNLMVASTFYSLLGLCLQAVLWGSVGDCVSRTIPLASKIADNKVGLVEIQPLEWWRKVKIWRRMVRFWRWCVFLGRFACIAMGCGYGGWEEIKVKKTMSILKSMTKSLVVERLYSPKIFRSFKLIYFFSKDHF